MSTEPVAYNHSGDTPFPDEFKDPVCGMTVKAESPHQYRYQLQEYRFCCAGCLTKFKADPEKYLNPTPEAEPPPAVPETAAEPGHQALRASPGNRSAGSPG